MLVSPRSSASFNLAEESRSEPSTRGSKTTSTPERSWRKAPIELNKREFLSICPHTF